MGAGKSTLGQQLAAHFDVSFRDMDSEIEEEQGMPIYMIWREGGGEGAFRNMETEWLSDFRYDEGSFVVATGGGVMEHPANIAYMKEVGTIVYLKCDIDTLYGRLHGDQSERPMLQTENDYKAHIRDLLEKREPNYLKADIVALEDDHHPQGIANLIKQERAPESGSP